MTLKAADSEAIDRGALPLDLRPFEAWLADHLLGSVSLIFEDGPGFGGRARDMLPLDSRLVLIDDDEADLDSAAAMLRGKGFSVDGYLPASADLPRGRTETTGLEEAGGLRLINVADPGAIAPRDVPVMPVETIWTRAVEIEKQKPVGVLAGWGVRAATAVGIFERLGFRRVVFVRTRERGSKPPTADKSTLFRVN